MEGEELARAEAIMRHRIRRQWMAEGVSIPDPPSVYIDPRIVTGAPDLI